MERDVIRAPSVADAIIRHLGSNNGRMVVAFPTEEMAKHVKSRVKKKLPGVKTRVQVEHKDDAPDRWHVSFE